jgi:threonine dehydrogenase-like Zn-dependent dehydrogenase
VKAVALVSPDNVAIMDDWPEPSCGPDEVIVRIQGVGVCGSDLAVIAGRRSVPALPWVLGHEAFGVILATGRNVADRYAGQRVVVEPNYPCLACGPCRSGETAGCRNRRAVGISEPGLLAERAAVPARFTWPVPETWEDADVVCVEPFTVALNAVRMSGLRPGDRCLIVGAGSQGLLVSLAVAHVGGLAYVTEPHAGRKAFAVQMGARDAGSLETETPFPVVIETSGAPEAFEEAVARTAPGGCLIVVVQRRLTVRGCLIYDHPAGFAHTIATLTGHDLRLGRVVRERYELAHAPTAFARAADIAGKTWIEVVPS